MTEITPELLRELLRYEPETGKLFWKQRPASMFARIGDCNSFNAQFGDKEAFTSTNSWGYPQGAIFARSYKAHRVAWAIHYGEWPNGNIDHINHDRTDNRIKNLRVVSSRENSTNRSRASNNTSGFTGVSWCKHHKKWLTYIKTAGRIKNLGYFKILDDAINARQAANIKYGYHENHGMQSGPQW